MIKIDENNNKVVTYDNDPDVERQLFPNIPLTVDISPLQDEIDALDERVGAAEDDISSIQTTLQTFNGQPVVVDSVEDMTDQNIIYVYVGDEAGYTSGDWYYYDGTEWVSGGAYVANPVVIDDTLTQAGEAADAKAVGDELTQIKSDFSASDLVVDVDFDNGNFEGYTTGCYVDNTGKITSSSSWKSVCMKIPPHLTKIEGAFGSATSTLLGIAFYSKNAPSANTFISGVEIGTNGSKKSVSVPAGTVFVIITTRPQSFANYWAKLYFDYSDAAFDASLCVNEQSAEKGYVGYKLYAGYYNSSNTNIQASTKTASTDKYRTDNVKTVFAYCPGFVLSIFKFTEMKSAAQYALREVSGNYYRYGDVSGSEYFAISLRKPDSSDITPEEFADAQAKLVILKSYKPYIDQKSAYESMIVGMNADREQLFSNFVWPINPDGGNAKANAGKMLTFLHFSDIHSDGTNLQRVVDYYNAYKSMINDVLFTGDYVNENNTNSLDFWTGVNGADKILGVIGNHDATNTSDHYATNVSQHDLYTKYFYGIAGWGCTYETDTTWWYKDYTTQGIRLIGLNSSLDSTNAATQLAWLINLLADAKTNSLAVVIMIHFPVLGSKTDSLFTAIDYAAPSTVSHCVSADIIDAVDDFIEDDGHFICYLTGHTHFDLILQATARNTQVGVVVTTAKNEDGFYGDQARKAGTRSNDAFNLVSIDKIGHTVKVIRIGANVDHYIRPRNTIAINYLTGDVITEA